MKTGYDQFFKKVRTQAAKPKVQVKMTPAPVRKAKKPALQPKAKAAPKTVPWKVVSICSAGFAISVLGLFAPQQLEPLLNSVEITLFGPAIASEGEKLADSQQANAAKAAETKAKTPESGAPNPASWSKEEMSLFSKLNERKKELDLREAELNKLDEELQQQKSLLEKRLKELDQMRAQIADTLKNQVEVDREKVDRLVEFYSNMKPQQAAKIIETLNEDLAVETLGRMKKKNAAEIMNLLEPKKAQSISEKFAGYKRK